MALLGDPALHFYMTRGMARALGVHLGDALNDGRLAPDTYAEMVTRCRACPRAQQCQALLATSVDLGAAPTECPNASDFSRLRHH